MHFALRPTASLLVALGLLSPFAGAQDDASRAGVRRDFITAMAAVDASPFPPPGGDPQSLQAYALFPYLQAARLNRQLARASATMTQPDVGNRPLDRDIAAFLAEQGDRPVTRSLRSNWLGSLATRRAWDTFLENYQQDRDAQPALRCHA